jgi:hypothetical protein
VSVAPCFTNCGKAICQAHGCLRVYEERLEGERRQEAVLALGMSDNGVGRYRVKPVEFEAIQFTGHNDVACLAFWHD